MGAWYPANDAAVRPAGFVVPGNAGPEGVELAVGGVVDEGNAGAALGLGCGAGGGDGGGGGGEAVGVGDAP